MVNGYFVHYFAPQNIPRMKRKVLFILDTSGSMIGTKIRQLKIAMLDILSSLDEGDRFNIIKFTDVVTRWWNHSALVEVTPYSVSAAKEFINDVTADGCEWFCHPLVVWGYVTNFAVNVKRYNILHETRLR